MAIDLLKRWNHIFREVIMVMLTWTTWLTYIKHLWLNFTAFKTHCFVVYLFSSTHIENISTTVDVKLDRITKGISRQHQRVLRYYLRSCCVILAPYRNWSRWFSFATSTYWFPCQIIILVSHWTSWSSNILLIGISISILPIGIIGGSSKSVTHDCN